MVGSTKANVIDHRHDQRQQLHNLMDDDDSRHRHGCDGEEDGCPSFGVSCSICLELVSDNGGRSMARLQCGHEFHLDCIGSAFNTKGAMQCPNCRNVEKGQWLYANGSSHSLHDSSMDDLIPEEDLYDFYSEMHYRDHWCPFVELARVGSSFEEVESPPITYHDLRVHRTVYAEHNAASSATHSYVAYVGPIPPMQHHSWDLHSPPFSITSGHINGVDPASVLPLTMRLSDGESDTNTRTTSFPYPTFFGRGSGPTAGGSFVSPFAPRHPGIPAQTHERIPIPLAFPHQQQPSNSPGMPSPIVHGVRRFDGPRGSPMVVPAPPQHDPSGGFFIVPASSSSGQNPHEVGPFPIHLRAWEIERERIGSSFNQNGGSSDSGNRSGSFWP